jgi:hypothetical protein
VQRKTISDQLVFDRSTANIEFFLDIPSSGDVIIPKGTLVYNDVSSFSSSQYSYTLSGDVIILSGMTKGYGAVQPNFQSNDYVASVGSLTRHNYISPPGSLVFCSNPKEIYPVLNSIKKYPNWKDRGFGTNNLRLKDFRLSSDEANTEYTASKVAYSFSFSAPVCIGVFTRTQFKQSRLLQI